MTIYLTKEDIYTFIYIRLLLDRGHHKEIDTIQVKGHQSWENVAIVGSSIFVYCLTVCATKR
jgi:hypothetical protein